MDVIFVVGCGRSGTSALTRVLSLCGAGLPPRMLRASEANPEGYWEPEVALKRNAQYMRSLGSSYHDPSLSAAGEITRPSAVRTQFEKNIRAFLEEMPPDGPVVIKEPRISALIEPWISVCEAMGHGARIIHIFRNPVDVCASFNRRYQIPDELSQALWLKYNLIPERATRHLRRLFVSYAQLLSDWQGIVQRCNGAWGTSLDTGDETAAAVQEFLSAELRHHEASALDRLADLTPGSWLARVYRALQSASAGRDIDMAAMDGVFEEQVAADRFFRTAQLAYAAKFAEEARKPPEKKEKAAVKDKGEARETGEPAAPAGTAPNEGPAAD